MECIEASSSTVASSTDSRAMDVSMTRPRWKKALSLGSTASSADTDRCTDLDELDLEALAADGVLTLNPKTGIYSGWVHVSTSGPGKVAFAKRFCRLEELVCKFYVSSEDAEQRAQPVGRHVIISVRRVHTHNKTFAFTDYEDRTVLMHTCIGADFEHWYGTFAAIIKATQVAKTHNSSATRRTTAFTPTARVGRNHRAAEERLRALTMPELNSPLNSTASDRPQGRELPPIAVDENDPERTHTVWLYIQAPWWRQLLRKRIRRYFVFSGANVSCFSVNKEGKRATFSHTITSCVYNSEQDATSIELEYGNTHRKLRLCGTNDGRNAVVAAAKYIQNALELST